MPRISYALTTSLLFLCSLTPYLKDKLLDYYLRYAQIQMEPTSSSIHADADAVSAARPGRSILPKAVRVVLN